MIRSLSAGFFVTENPNDRIEFTEEEKAQTVQLPLNRKHFESVVSSFAEKTNQVEHHCSLD